MESQLSTNNCGFISIWTFFPVLTFLLLANACSKDKKDSLTVLDPVAVYTVNVPETSDLCFGATTDILYTVSDRTAKVYKITSQGKVLSELPFTGSDLEGVFCLANQFLYVVEERLRLVYKLDLQGNILGQKTIPVENNDENQGLEGITYAAFNKHFYILNEKNPALLIETDEDLNVLKSYPIEFSSDCSGICVDNINQQLWIVSDEEATVNQCTMQGELVKSYRIPVSNPEGIAFDPEGNKLYVISDAEARLYLFELTN
jgi:uncharacterized protein YjiK